MREEEEVVVKTKGSHLGKNSKRRRMLVEVIPVPSTWKAAH